MGRSVLMSTNLVQTRPTTRSASSLDFATVCLFSLLGLTLTAAAVLSFVSNETISMLFTSIG